jgi:hypothetical protein
MYFEVLFCREYAYVFTSYMPKGAVCTKPIKNKKTAEAEEIQNSILEKLKYYAAYNEEVCR